MGNFSHASIMKKIIASIRAFCRPFIFDEPKNITDIFEPTPMVSTMSNIYIGENFGDDELPNAFSPEYIASLVIPETKNIMKLLDCGQGRQAKEELTKLIAETPTDFRLYILRAYCIKRVSGNSVDMEKDFANALQYDPDNIMVLRSRCPAVATKNRYLRHIEDLTRLIELDPKHSSYYFLDRGWRYYWVGNLEAAKVDVSIPLERGDLRSNADMRALCKNLEITI